MAEPDGERAARSRLRLFADLPGRNGVLKGLSLGAVFAGAWLPVELLPVDPGSLSAWLVALEVGLYFVLLGIAMDWLTLRAHRVYWRPAAGSSPSATRSPSWAPWS